MRLSEVAVLCDALGVREVPVAMLHEMAGRDAPADPAALLRRHGVIGAGPCALPLLPPARPRRLPSQQATASIGAPLP